MNLAIIASYRSAWMAYLYGDRDPVVVEHAMIYREYLQEQQEREW